MARRTGSLSNPPLSLSHSLPSLFLSDRQLLRHQRTWSVSLYNNWTQEEEEEEDVGFEKGHRRACTATLFPHSIVSGVAPHYHSRWDGAWKSQGVDSNGGGCGGSGWTIESNGIHRSITFSSGCREVTVRASSSTSRRGNWRKAIAPQQQKYINARGFHHVLSIDISSIYAGASLSCLTRTNPFSSTRERRKWLNLVSLSRNSLLRTSYWE